MLVFVSDRVRDDGTPGEADVVAETGSPVCIACMPSSATH